MLCYVNQRSPDEKHSCHYYSSNESQRSEPKQPFILSVDVASVRALVNERSQLPPKPNSVRLPSRTLCPPDDSNPTMLCGAISPLHHGHKAIPYGHQRLHLRRFFLIATSAHRFLIYLWRIADEKLPYLRGKPFALLRFARVAV